MGNNRNHRAKRLSADEFIRIWQAAETVEQVAEETGAHYTAVLSRARRYRERGVQLRELQRSVRPHNYGNDWDALRALAVELRPGSE